MGFTLQETVNIDRKISAGVIDANSIGQWYDSWVAYAPNVLNKSILTQFDSVPAASTLAIARSNATSNPTLISDLSQNSSAVRLSAVSGTNTSTYLATSTYGNTSDALRLRNWISPTRVPSSTGSPSSGYVIQVYQNNPATGGTLIGQSTGLTGTGTATTPAWVFNYEQGILLISDDYKGTLTNPYIMGFRYIGNTLTETLAGLGGGNQAEVDAIELAAGLNTNGTYTAPTGTNFLGTSTSIMNAVALLDAATYARQTAAQVTTAITSYGYQTAAQVNTAITGYGYQTSSQITTAITSYGYQTSAQVSSAIAAAAYVLPTASTSTVGGVKVDGTTITITNGVISAVDTVEVTSFNTRTGAVTLNSIDVTSALGYTPYDSANTAGYQTATQVTTAITTAIATKANTSSLSLVATTGKYSDLIGLPSIPSAQVNSDWNSTSGISAILNKPILFSGSYSDLTNKPTLFSGSYTDLSNKPTLFSGSYTDLTNKPVIPTVPTTVSSFTNDSGYQTAANVTSLITTATSTKADISYVDTQISSVQSQVNTLIANEVGEVNQAAINVSVAAEATLRSAADAALSARIDAIPAGAKGETGATGQSAYQIAVSLGFAGTEAEWLASLQGPQGSKGLDGTNGVNGTSGVNGTNGIDGKSAYDLAVVLGYMGTLTDWVASLKGAKGDTGTVDTTLLTAETSARIAGDQTLQSSIDALTADVNLLKTNEAGEIVGITQAALDTAIAAEATLRQAADNDLAGRIAAIPTGPKGDTGSTGASAYDIAVSLGFQGTEVQWLSSLIGLQGPKGDPGVIGLTGLSAYQIAVYNGFQGTEIEWLLSLKGTNGIDGTGSSIVVQTPLIGINVQTTSTVDSIDFTQYSQAVWDVVIQTYSRIRRFTVASLYNSVTNKLNYTTYGIIGDSIKYTASIGYDSLTASIKLYITNADTDAFVVSALRYPVKKI